MKLITLNKDQSVTRNKFKKIDLDITKYILFPVGLDTNAFFILKPNDIMRRFHHVKIIMDAEVENVSEWEYGNLEYEERRKPKCSPLYGELNTEDYIEFVQYLHSLNRLQYLNELGNNSESIHYSYIHIPYFSIEIFDISNVSIYKKEFNECNDSSIYPTDILDTIKKVYNPLILEQKVLYEDYDYISILNDTWKITGDIEEGSLLGMPYSDTKSYGFFPCEMLQDRFEMNWMIACLQFNNTNYNAGWDVYEFATTPGLLEDDTPEEAGVYYHDLWTCELSEVLEYFTFIKYIWTTTQFIGELISYGQIKGLIKSFGCLIMDNIGDNDPDYARDYPSDESKNFEFNEDSIPTVYDILQKSYYHDTPFL